MSIERMPDGAYIDLSKVVYISSIDKDQLFRSNVYSFEVYSALGDGIKDVLKINVCRNCSIPRNVTERERITQVTYDAFELEREELVKKWKSSLKSGKPSFKRS